MNQIIEFLFLRSDSLFDSFTIAQTIVHVLILVLDLVIWTAFHSLIPWIVSIVKKKPMTKNGFRVLSILFAVSGCGRILVATENLAIAEAPRDLFALFCGVCVYAASFYLGIYILKRRGKILEDK